MTSAEGNGLFTFQRIPYPCAIENVPSETKLRLICGTVFLERRSVRILQRKAHHGSAAGKGKRRREQNEESGDSFTHSRPPCAHGIRGRSRGSTAEIRSTIPESSCPPPSAYFPPCSPPRPIPHRGTHSGS